MDKETQELMDELKAEGQTFAGDEPETPKEETPNPEPKKEQKKELEGEKPKEEPKKEEPETPADELPERAPRKPKEIPAWQAEIAKKRAAKEAEAKAKAEQEKSKDINKINQEPKANEVSDAKQKIAKLKEKYKDTVTESFLDDLADLIPSAPKMELPEEVKTKLAQFDEILASNRQTKEDLEYNSAFNAQVAPMLKQQYPHISDEDLQSIQSKLKEHYFDERYISLSPKEIYAIKSDELKELVGSPKKSGGEKGTKGVSRGSKEIDYGNLTEEEYAALPDDEADKANAYLAAKERKR